MNFRWISCAFIALTMMACNSGSKEIESTTAEVAQTVADATSPTNTAPSAPAIDANNAAKFEFQEELYNYGTVDEGTVVTHSFKFKNTGNVPMVIESAKASCGCTIPSPPKEPIAPGESNEIEVKFNTTGKTSPGAGRKVITITANTFPPQTRVTIDGKVTPKKKPAQPAVTTAPSKSIQKPAVQQPVIKKPAVKKSVTTTRPTSKPTTSRPTSQPVH